MHWEYLSVALPHQSPALICQYLLNQTLQPGHYGTVLDLYPPRLLRPKSTPFCQDELSSITATEECLKPSLTDQILLGRTVSLLWKPIFPQA